MLDWTNYPNFSEEEFKCKHSGECFMDEKTLEKAQKLRNLYGKPMRITSGYRSSNHPVEIKRKESGRIGPHTTGKAFDTAVMGSEAHQFLKVAQEIGFTGIGVQQKGNKRFIHLDTIKKDEYENIPRPWIWSY